MNQSKLLEGGNVFKTADKQSLTQRIATKDVPATIDFLEKIAGLDFTKELDPDDKKPVKWLGTTGRKEDPDGTFELNSSGDLDLSVDAREISKEQLIAKLADWCRNNGVPEEEIFNKGFFPTVQLVFAGNDSQGLRYGTVTHHLDGRSA